MTTPDPDDGRTCPACGSRAIQAYYTNPPLFVCASCKANLVDENMPGFRTLTPDQARRKRPAMYGLSVCSPTNEFGRSDCCSHAPHTEGACEFCEADKPHIYKFRISK